MRKSVFFIVISSIVGFLVFMFLTLFDYVYPPVDGKGTAGKKREKQEVVLYFSDDNERFLVPEKRFIPKEEKAPAMSKELVRALIDGSKTGLVNTFPGKVEVQYVKVDNDTVFVDFNKSLLKNHPGGSASEMATIFSLTNTLTENVPGIKKVKILVAGKEIPSIKGHIDTRQPFAPNRELIVKAQKEG
ncbi:MAG: GerMN domain-containing protein [Syntrophales bacterium]|nr:GerMN domain-containing protein [Syntrophales bacterium]